MRHYFDSIARKPDLLANKNIIVEMVEKENGGLVLGVIAPSVVALCASIKLSGRSSADLVWSIHQNAVPFLHCGHSILVVGSASNTVSFHDLERDILGGLDVRFFSASSSIFLVLKPHFGQAISSSSPETGLKRVSHFGQNRKSCEPSLLFDGRFDHTEKLF